VADGRCVALNEKASGHWESVGDIGASHREAQPGTHTDESNSKYVWRILFLLAEGFVEQLRVQAGIPRGAEAVGGGGWGQDGSQIS